MASPTHAERMIEFINESWTAYHAVASAKKRLLAAGFDEISERDVWTLTPGGRYFFTRNMSTLVAFAVGKEYESGNGITVIGAHTDSPCPKLKPNAHVESRGFIQVGLQPYGGGLWHTWFDRDLGIAGRVIVRRDGGTRLSHELVRIDKPILRIPTLAIHLEDASERKAFAVNKQRHLPAVLATAFKQQLGEDAATTGSDNEPAKKKAKKAATPAWLQPPPQQPTPLLQLLATELRCDPGDIADLELQLCDTQPSCIGGLHDEFVYSGRLDNLCSSYCALQALIDASTDASLACEPNVRMIALFDHEEVGSTSAQGAGSTVMAEALKRTITSLARSLKSGSAAAAGEMLVEGLIERAMRRSFLVSADMAHAVHPNYGEKHEPQHQPRIHAGQVIKHNANQRYATDAVSAFIFRELGRLAGVPVQEFVVRSDCGCGSTIGPTLSALTGLRTVDVGAPQLSMHSIREVMGTDDVAHSVAHFTSVFERFAALDASLSVDAVDG